MLMYNKRLVFYVPAFYIFFRLLILFYFQHYVKTDYATFFVNYFEEKSVLFERATNVKGRERSEAELSFNREWSLAPKQ